jgi:hypothetical protein
MRNRDTHGPAARFSAASLLICLALLGAGPAAAVDAEAEADAGSIELTSGVISSLPTIAHKGGRLDSALSAVADAAEASPSVALEKARVAGLRTSKGKVHALLTVAPTELDSVATSVRLEGGQVTGVGNRGRYVQAFLPPGKLRQLARQPGVISIRRPPTFVPAAGAQMTQGDAALNGAAWRAKGVNGSGVKIGIIDVGFSGYTTLLGTDLPAAVTVKNFVDGQSDAQVNGTTKHGTACAEIIHDVAPGAQLYFAKVAQVLDIEEAADWLQAQGVKVISSSIGTYNVTPGDGTGYFEDIVAQKRAAGITWFTAASNDRESHWGGASNVDADGFQVYGGSQNVNYFGPGNGDPDPLPSGWTLQVNVRWSDWTDGSVDQDFDLYLVRWSGSAWTEMAQIGGTDEQTGEPGHLPVETAFAMTTGTATFYGFVVSRYSATQSVNFEMFAAGIPLDKRVQARSLSNLADTNSAVTVAALDVGTFTQERYSSEGPTNGPGGILTGGQMKPDLSAFANVNTVSYGTGAGKFNGTSAATPHAAAAGALVLSANPAFSPNQVESFLTSHAVDQGPVGLDTDFGYGRLHLGSAPGATDLTPPTVGAPDADFRTNVAVAKTSTPLKLRVDFTASDASGIASTQLQQKVGSGSFANVSLTSATAVSADLSVSTSATTTRQFKARATDTATNTSPYATGSPFKVRALQNGSASTVQSGAWTTHSLAKFYGGSVRKSAAAGAQQSLAMTMQDVAIVSTLGPNRGIAQVWLDGSLVATVDLYSPTKQFRRVVWAADFATPGSHTVVLRATGTKRAASSGKRVDLDAFLVMQP